MAIKRDVEGAAPYGNARPLTIVGRSDVGIAPYKFQPNQRRAMLLRACGCCFKGGIQVAV